MTKTQARKYLAAAFLALNKTQKANLLHHAVAGTGIFAGNLFYQWCENGYGCPAVLASFGSLPDKQPHYSSRDGKYMDRVYDFLSNAAARAGGQYCTALKTLTESEVRRLIRRVLA